MSSLNNNNGRRMILWHAKPRDESMSDVLTFLHSRLYLFNSLFNSLHLFYSSFVRQFIIMPAKNT
jgi:hypothetical protein